MKHEMSGDGMDDAKALTIRPFKRSDRQALTELIRLAWYADGDTTDDDTTDDTVEDAAESTAEDVVRESFAPSKPRNAQGLSVSRRLAAIDAEECLSRTTHAAAAEYDGRVIGVILGSLRFQATRGQSLRHRMRRMRMALPLLGSRAGIRGLCDQLAMRSVDRKLLRDTHTAYQAEIVLFIVSPEARGHGVGRRLFGHMIDYFRAADITRYFLFTDTSCNVGFYTHSGLQCKASRTIAAGGCAASGALGCFLYEGSVPGDR